MLICSGVIERTLTNIACKTRVICLFSDAVERIIPFDLQASSGDVGAMPSQPVLELVAPQGVVVVEEGIPGFGGSDVRTDQGVGEGMLGIAAVAVAVAAAAA